MKKLLSIVILVICSAASVLAIIFVSTLVFTLIQMIYASSRALFWIVLFLGGSFGLGLFWYIIPLAAQVTISASQKYSLSKKGLRYTVMGILIIVLYGLNLLGLIINNTATNLASSILSYVLLVLYAVVLIVQGKSTAVSEYIPPADSIEVSAAATVVSAPVTSYAKKVDGEKLPTSVNDQERPIPDESLRTLKELYDSGVLSEEEFIEKKKQLLGL